MLGLLLREMYSEVNFEHSDMRAVNTADEPVVVHNSSTIRALLFKFKFK
jgi:hypothetical protein